ncbi:MAG: hypothetical protein KDD25_06155, partial [Bdellovibrionales bacterium]|nr:hypothetical protein [Bdellovibrionales bacterium]
SHVQINHSFQHWWALGFHRFQVASARSDKYAHFLSTNFLLKRWNGDSYQANLYSILGLGETRLVDEYQAGGLGGLQFDIEDRKYYFLAKYMEIRNSKEFEFQETNLRAGLAPYVAGFDSLHSWLILDWSHSGTREGQFRNEVTPTLRMFYRNVLFEIGQSFEGNTKFNFISHF